MNQQLQADSGTGETFTVLITAEEAWPAFERAVLAAKDEISAGFRIFDFSTRLICGEACAVGETWADLIEDAVRRGVRFRLVVSDFDPVMAAPLHEIAQETLRQAAAIKARLGPELAGNFTVVASLHPARAGALPRAAFLPFVMRKFRELKPKRRAAAKQASASLSELRPVSHHHKLAVIDRETLYIGGLDLNSRRYDKPGHDLPAHLTWADVQLVLRGPEAEEAAQHLDGFLDEIARVAPPRGGRLVRRTLSAPRKAGFWAVSPETLLSEIEEDYLAAFESAQTLIYAETQFLRSQALAQGLARAAREKPDLSLILVLPALPEDVAFDGNRSLDARYGLALQADALSKVMEAFGDRACIATPVQQRLAARDTPAVLAGSPVIHVHSKILIADSHFAMAGSANMNGRSMRWDTEAAVRISEPARISMLWQALARHWWQGSLPPEALDLSTARAWWQEEIRRNGVRVPENRRGLLVPHDPENMAELRQRVPGATEDIV